MLKTNINNEKLQMKRIHTRELLQKIKQFYASH